MLLLELPTQFPELNPKASAGLYLMCILPTRAGYVTVCIPMGLRHDQGVVLGGVDVELGHEG